MQAEVARAGIVNWGEVLFELSIRDGDEVIIFNLPRPLLTRRGERRGLGIHK